MGAAGIDEERCVRAWAASGAMHLTGAPSGPPAVAPAGIVRPLVGLAGGLARATRALGREVMVDPVALAAQRAAFTRSGRQGSTSVGGSARMLRSADGWVALNLPRPSDVESLPALVGANVSPADWHAVVRRLEMMPVAEIVERASLLGLAVAAVGATAPPEQPWRLLEVQPEQASPLPEAHPGQIAVVDAPPPPMPRQRMGIHTGQAAAPRARPGCDSPGRARPGKTASGYLAVIDYKTGNPAPVVLDLTSLWAGPLAGGLLAAAGCSVLKVESATRPDGARRGPPGFFDLLNGGKRQLSLPLGEPLATGRLRELIGGADIVLESSRPRVMRQWGIEPAEHVAQGKIWVSITGHGRGGSGGNRVAFGDDAAASAGLIVRGDPPMFVADAIADPIAGLAAATVAAQLAAEGRRGLADVSLAGAAAWAARLAGKEIRRPVVQSRSGWQVELPGGPAPVLTPGNGPGSNAHGRLAGS